MTPADAIAARRKAFVDAFAAEDIAAMADIVTKNHIGMPPNRPRVSGRKGAEEFWRDGFSAARSRFSIDGQDLVVSGNLAIDRFDWQMTVTPRDGGPTVEDRGKCVWIWENEGDAWRVSMAIWNSDLAEPGLWSGG